MKQYTPPLHPRVFRYNGIFMQSDHSISPSNEYCTVYLRVNSGFYYAFTRGKAPIYFMSESRLNRMALVEVKRIKLERVMAHDSWIGVRGTKESAVDRNVLAKRKHDKHTLDVFPTTLNLLETLCFFLTCYSNDSNSMAITKIDIREWKIKKTLFRYPWIFD